MKKLLIATVFVFLFISVNCFGQNDSIIVYSYVEALTRGARGSEFVLKQDGKFIVDKNNNQIYFDSPANGLNYLIQQGWKYEDFEVKVSEPVFLISRKEKILEN